MPYKHGVYTQEIATSIIATVQSEASIPFVVGTAPVNMTDLDNVNRPVLCHSYAEAVEAFGFVPARKINPTDKAKRFEFTLCEFMKSYFSLYGAQPVIMVNVCDPDTHKNPGTISSLTLDTTTGAAVIDQVGVIPSTIELSKTSTTYVLDTDYTVTFNADGKAIVTSLKNGDTFRVPVGEALTLSYDVLCVANVSLNDVIGGVDSSTGAYKGLELVNQCFSYFRLTPGLIVCPRYSAFPSVAAVMATKADSINEHFRAMALVDIPSGNDSVGSVSVTGVLKYSDVPAFKNTNNIVEPCQVACWPCVALDGELYHMSTQLAGVMATTDADHDDVPYVSPSNHGFKMDSAVLKNGTEVWLDCPSANYLNGQGVVTALNFIGGWKAWGNRTACYPANTDVKDSFIPVRRMFAWLGNSLVQTYFQRVDAPLNRRQIETIVDSANIWLNGLAAQEYILGGRVEFIDAENPDTQLIDGCAVFHVYFTPAPPNREIEFKLEYDISYLSTLFE